jgi:preprotein translocase subunit SecF
MEILRNSTFDFMKYRRFWVTVSMITILAGLVGIFYLDRLNFGVDFAGGTQLTLKFRQQPDLEDLRALAADAGFGDAVIQRFGGEDANEVMLRTPVVGGSEEGSAARVVGALNERFNSGASRPDLNQIGGATLGDLLARSDPDGIGTERASAHYGEVAEAVMAVRKTSGMFSGWDEIRGSAGLSEAAFGALRETVSIGEFAVLGTENVGPQVGAELRKRGILAVVGAIFGMLAYIWLRFELRFAIGATMAVLHDVLITLGVFAWFGHEFNLTTVAAFLTLIGYSVNDTVVTFDRVRENLRKSRSLDTVTLLNKSINQTLSRTLLTGGTTLLASMALLIYGGDVIRGFAFVMSIGVLIGTYSSIYIASPFALLWEEWFGPRGRFRRGADHRGQRRAR